MNTKTLETITGLERAVRQAGGGFYNSASIGSPDHETGISTSFDLFDLLLIGGITESSVLLTGRTDSGKTDLAKIVMTALFGAEEKGWHRLDFDIDFGRDQYTNVDFSVVSEGKKTSEGMYDGLPYLQLPGLIMRDGGTPPLNICMFMKDNAELALNLSEKFAAYMGCDAVYMHLLLDADVRKAVEKVGLRLVSTIGTTEDTFAGVFIDMIGSNEEEKSRYRLFTSSFLDLRYESVREKTEVGSVVAASWYGLTMNQLSKRNLPNNKIQWLVLKFPAPNSGIDYLGFIFNKNLIYAHIGDGSIGEANEVAEVFNAATHLSHDEFFQGDEFGIYCHTSRKTPGAFIRAQFSIDTVLDYLASETDSDKRRKARVHVGYGNLSPEDLAASRLPPRKLTTWYEHVTTNPQAQKFSDGTVPQDIRGATIKFLERSDRLFLAQYQFAEGVPELHVTPEHPDIQSEQQVLGGTLTRVVTDLSTYCSIRGIPAVGESGSALIRLNAMPSLGELKRTFDELFPSRYTITEVRWRDSVHGQISAPQ